MGLGVTKSYIWSFLNRFLHAVMMISFALAYFIQRESLELHIFFGVLFASAVVLRILWGFFGTRYSRFADFAYSGIIAYFASIFGQKQHFVGHNPASSWAILLILFLGILLSVSGFLELGITKNQGFFAFVYHHYSSVSFLDDIHHYCAHALAVVIILHIFGALLDYCIHQNDSIPSMISGYKQTNLPQNISLTFGQKSFSVLSVLLLIIIGIYVLTKDNKIIQNHSRSVDYAAMNQNFANECGSCHAIYPPFLLPKQSWTLMMGDLENHFGDDASIETEQNEEITNFLRNNSAEHFDTKVAQKIIAEQKDPNNIAITKNKYWIKSHATISAKTFAQPSIKSKANCFACHKQLEQGILTLPN